MYMKYLPMNGKILSLMCVLLFVSFSIAGVFTMVTILDEQRHILREQAILMARTVSEISIIEQAVNQPVAEAHAMIHETVEELRIINDAAYIVVMNMEHVRLTHPTKRIVGTVSQSTDIQAAFSEHYYTNEAQGELGKTVRAFAPIVNSESEQVGVVVVGYLLPNVMDVLKKFQAIMWVTGFITVLCSIIGATLLSRHMKRQMFGLEPHEIAQLYMERTETFNAMHEGIIAIDAQERITIFNPKAQQILQLKGQFIGQPIETIIHDTRLPEILRSGKPVYNEELHIQNRSIISNRVPIRVQDETVGVVAIFQDRTEVKILAEKLTGVKAFVEALRVQTHEYKNKLHTISGLLQLNKPTEALTYISELQYEHDVLTSMLQERIAFEQIAGLLLSKVQVGREQGVNVVLDPLMQLQHIPPKLDQHDIVIVLGNLIENALEALRHTEGEKEIYVSIEQEDDFLAMYVSDNGCGMTEEQQANMMTYGFSTKAKQGRGIGLYLVEKIRQKGDGELTVTSNVGEGTTIIITF
ncbi:MAG: sensor histidine kinase [Caryophanon sp.]|nr:sensor histidine kinase [Caryophanon sp.]